MDFFVFIGIIDLSASAPSAWTRSAKRGVPMGVRIRIFVFILVPTMLWCQADTDTPSVAELAGQIASMKSVIERLQQRVAELEAKQGAATAAVVPARSPGAQQAVPADPHALSSSQPVASPAIGNFLRGTSANVLLDTYYGYNFNDPIGRVNWLRAYDVLSNAFSLGQATIVFDNAPGLALKPGSVALIPPHYNHWDQYGPEPKHRVLWVGFELDTIATRHPEWNLSESLQRVHFAHDSTHLERHFLQVIREATTPSLHRTSGLRLALDTLLLEIVRDIVEPSKISSLMSIHPAISKALAILETRFKKNWSLVELAGEVGISRSRLAELFNLEVGCSVHKFLNRVRVRQAEALLSQSNLSIGEIALECGFATIQHFSRIFKEVNGQAALNFRRRSEYPGMREPRLLSQAS